MGTFRLWFSGFSLHIFNSSNQIDVFVVGIYLLANSVIDYQINISLINNEKA